VNGQEYRNMVILSDRVRTRQDAIRVRGALVSLVADLPLDPVVRASLIAGTARELRRIVAGGGGRIEVRLEAVDGQPVDPWPSAPADDDQAVPDDDVVLDPLLDLVREQHDALSWHQAELAETNAGLL